MEVLQEVQSFRSGLSISKIIEMISYYITFFILLRISFSLLLQEVNSLVSRASVFIFMSSIFSDLALVNERELLTSYSRKVHLFILLSTVLYGLLTRNHMKIEGKNKSYLEQDDSNQKLIRSLLSDLVKLKRISGVSTDSIQFSDELMNLLEAPPPGYRISNTIIDGIPLDEEFYEENSSIKCSVDFLQE